MAKLVRKKKTAPDDDVLPKTLRIAHLASEHKAGDIRAYNVEGLTIVADSFVVCSAASEPQLKAICNNVSVGMKEVGVKASHTEGNHASGWVVMDFGSVILPPLLRLFERSQGCPLIEGGILQWVRHSWGKSTTGRIRPRIQKVWRCLPTIPGATMLWVLLMQPVSVVRVI